MAGSWRWILQCWEAYDLDEDQAHLQRALPEPSGSRLRAQPGDEPCPTVTFVRSPYSAWNPQDPAGTMAQAVDDPGESHGWAVTPGRARAPHQHNSPWRPSSRPANGLGYACAHNLSISGTPRVCRPKGRNTVRAGGMKRRPDLNALSQQAIRRPGSPTPSPVTD
jgi:hypothetical protein